VCGIGVKVGRQPRPDAAIITPAAAGRTAIDCRAGRLRLQADAVHAAHAHPAHAAQGVFSPLSLHFLTHLVPLVFHFLLS
jgi:hypothetical protein